MLRRIEKFSSNRFTNALIPKSSSSKPQKYIFSLSPSPPSSPTSLSPTSPPPTSSTSGPRVPIVPVQRTTFTISLPTAIARRMKAVIASNITALLSAISPIFPTRRVTRAACWCEDRIFPQCIAEKLSFATKELSGLTYVLEEYLTMVPLTPIASVAERISLWSKTSKGPCSEELQASNFSLFYFYVDPQTRSRTKLLTQEAIKIS